MSKIINWENEIAAIWRAQRHVLHAIKQIDPINLDSLVGIEKQKHALIDNTQRFLNNLPANNALLWGARGTGKSSLVKALLNHFHSQGLRIIEIDKCDLDWLPDIVDDIRTVDKKFLIYCDDLSFESNEMHYKSLKRVLEGSIELPPKNVLIYATSNRRHLMPEFMTDNLGTQLIDTELHYTDQVEEKIALSDRFGLWLSFYPINIDEYLTIVDFYFREQSIDKQVLHDAAREFASLRATHSGRTAQQFYRHFSQAQK